MVDAPQKKSTEEFSPVQKITAVEILWSGATRASVLPKKEIHVFAIRLNDEKANATRQILSPDELDRAAKYRFEIHRRRFIASRGALREILASYLDVKPLALEFVYGESGKPSLAEKFSAQKLHFNLAHSEDLALVAVARDCEVGVDIEKIRPVKDCDEIAARFFSKRESEALKSLPHENRLAAFFHLWTRKEAWLKATGKGIGEMLNQVEVSCQPGEPAQLLLIPTNLQKADWSLFDLSPTKDFTGALAVARRGVSIRCRHWTS